MRDGGGKNVKNLQDIYRWPPVRQLSGAEAARCWVRRPTTTTSSPPSSRFDPSPARSIPELIPFSLADIAGLRPQAVSESRLSGYAVIGCMTKNSCTWRLIQPLTMTRPIILLDSVVFKSGLWHHEVIIRPLTDAKKRGCDHWRFFVGQHFVTCIWSAL